MADRKKTPLTTKGWLMATNKDRGTKRTCQNGECGARFYDLNRSPVLCPICGTKYTIAHSTTAAATVAPPAPRKQLRALCFFANIILERIPILSKMLL